MKYQLQLLIFILLCLAGRLDASPLYDYGLYLKSHTVSAVERTTLYLDDNQPFPIKNDFIYFILCLAISKSTHSEHTLFKYSKSPSSLAVRLIGYYLLNSHSCFFQEHCITKKPNNLLSEWKVQDYILLILRIKEAELAELKCKMIFRFLRITEIPPLNHETVIVCIKAEDIIFCFYLF